MEITTIQHINKLDRKSVLRGEKQPGEKLGKVRPRRDRLSRLSPPRVLQSASFKMADDVDKKLELEDLQDLKTELILDCCSYRLWKEFKRGSKMSGELLSILRGK